MYTTRLLFILSMLFMWIVPFSHAQQQSCDEVQLTDITRRFERQADFQYVLDHIEPCLASETAEIATGAYRLQALSFYYLNHYDAFESTVVSLIEQYDTYAPPDSDPPFFKETFTRLKNQRLESTRKRRRNISIAGGLVIAGIATFITTQFIDSSTNTLSPLPDDPPEGPGGTP